MPWSTLSWLIATMERAVPIIPNGWDDERGRAANTYRPDNERGFSPAAQQVAYSIFKTWVSTCSANSGRDFPGTQAALPR